jgi:hypothetical protein
MGNSALFMKNSTNNTIHSNLSEIFQSDYTYLACLHPTDAQLFIEQSDYFTLPYKMSIHTWMNIMQKCSSQLVCKYYLYRFCYLGECSGNEETISTSIKSTSQAQMAIYGDDNTNIKNLLLDNGEIHQIDSYKLASMWNDAFLCFEDSTYVI